MAKTALNRSASAAVLASMAEGNGYGAKAIAAQIKWLDKAGTAYVNTAHAIAVAIMFRSIQHSDCSLAPSLVASLRGAHKEAMVAWFRRFTNVLVRFDKEKGCYVASMVNAKGSSFKPEVDTGAAMTTPFYDLPKQQKDPAAFDLAKRIASLLKSAEAAELSDTDKALLAALKSAATIAG